MTERDGLGHGPRKTTTYERLTVHEPTRLLKLEDLLDFIELPAFTKRWEQLRLDDEDLSALQFQIMADPKSPKPLARTVGLRKIRFAPRRWKRGKSGAVRVLYVYFERFGIVLLCLAYGKNETGSISEAVKQYLNKLIAQMERELHRRYFDS